MQIDLAKVRCLSGDKVKAPRVCKPWGADTDRLRKMAKTCTSDECAAQLGRTGPAVRMHASRQNISFRGEKK